MLTRGTNLSCNVCKAPMSRMVSRTVLRLPPPRAKRNVILVIMTTSVPRVLKQVRPSPMSFINLRRVNERQESLGALLGIPRRCCAWPRSTAPKDRSEWGPPLLQDSPCIVKTVVAGTISACLREDGARAACHNGKSGKVRSSKNPRTETAFSL